MSNRTLRIANFSGGLSDDDKLGSQYSGSDIQTLDFRKRQGAIGLQRSFSTEVSGTSFKGPRSFDAVRVSNGDVYFANGAYTYKRTPGSNGAVGTYAQETDADGNAVASSDLAYRPDVDALFLFTANAIHEKSPLSGTPMYKIEKYSYYRFYLYDTVTTPGTDTALSSAISEGVASIITFTCTKEPLRQIQFIIDTKGTGDWTVTIHNSANEVVATQTISSTYIPEVGDIITFNLFTGTTRLAIGSQYHVHLTESSGTGKVSSNTANDMRVAHCGIFADRLVTTSAFVGHATYQLGAKTYFCNERYIGEWEFLNLTGGDTSGYNAHRIILPAGYVSVGMAQYSEYLVTACAIPGSIETTAGSAAGIGGSGMLIFWDTTSTFYNFAIEVPQGVPEGLFSHRNRLYFIASGRLYYWAGDDIIEVFEFPGVDDFVKGSGSDKPLLDTYLSASRHCMTAYKNLLHVGYPFHTANANVKIGIYSFGKSKPSLPDATSFDYVSCNSNTTTTFKTTTSPDTPATGISLLKNFGGTVLSAWTHGLGTNGGIDRINETSGYATSGKWRSLWFDNGQPDVQKTPIAIKITFQPLQTGCTVTPVVQYDRGGTDITGTDNGETMQGVAGDVDVVFSLDTSLQFYEIMFGWNVTGSGTDDVRINSITFEFDDNREDTNATKARRATD